MIKHNSTKAFFAILLPISLLISNFAFADVGETPVQTQSTATQAGIYVANILKIFVGSVLMCSAGKTVKAAYDLPDKEGIQMGGIKGAAKYIFWNGLKKTHPWNEQSAFFRFWAPGLGGAALTACGITGILTEAGVIDNNVACAA